MNKDEIDNAADDSIFPTQPSDKGINATASAMLGTEKTAIVFFDLVKNRIQHINSWRVIAEQLSANFQLVNRQGLEVFRKVQEGDYVRAEFTIPDMMITRKRYLWLRTEDVHEDPDSYRFAFREATQPGEHTMFRNHFDHPLSTFFEVSRRGLSVIVSIRRELIAAAKTRNPLMQNTTPEIQWQALADGLLSR